MFFTFSPYALSLFLVTFVAVILFGVTLKKREEPGGYALLGVLFSLIIWTFFAGLSAGFSSIAYKIIATKLAYFGIVSLPINLLLFSIYYTSNERWLSQLRIFLLWFIPFMGLFLILTNEQHGLIWTGFAYRTSFLGSTLVFERGTGFWGLIIYFYTCVMFTLFMIVWTAFRFRYIYRKNMTILMVMVPLSLLVNILYVFNFFPNWSGYDPTPFSLILFSSLLVWSFSKHKFFDLSPIGREVVIDQMRALLLILDTEMRIVDFNHPMQKLIENIIGSSKVIHQKELIGHPTSKIFADWPEFIDNITENNPERNEIELCLEKERYVFEVQIKALENRDQKSLGWLIFLFDITDRIHIVEAEIRNRQIAQSLREIALVVNSSLDPERTLNLALEQIENIIKYDNANISILSGDHMVVEFVRGYENSNQMLGLKIPLESSPNQQALIHRHPVMYSDVQKYFPLYRQSPYNLIHSLLCIPMYAKDEVLGFLTLESAKKDYFSNDDISIAAAYASQVAVALQNSRLYVQVNRRLNEQSIINEIIQIAATRKEKKDYVRAMTNQIHRFIRTPGVLFAEYDSNEENWHFIDLIDVPEYQIDKKYSVKEGLTGYILQHGKPLLLNSTQEVHEFLKKNHRENIGPMPFGFMGAPMIIKDKVVGAIVAHDLESDNAFEQEDYNLLVMITSQAAIGFENVRLINQLENLARTDALTGIYNRGYYHDVSKTIISSGKQTESQISMIMMDVDLFKILNDKHGHQVGDVMLQKTVEACKSLLREKDIIGRVGGEEFSIMLPDTNLNEAEKIAERIRQAIENLKVRSNGHIVQTTVSLGVASLNQLEFGSLDELIRISDQALYRAKADGRNCVRVFNLN